MYGFVTKKFLVLVAIIGLCLFVSPVSASTANDLGTITVIQVEPVNGKKDEESNTTHRDGYCLEGLKEPPAILCAENSQENNYYTALVSARKNTELNLDQQTALWKKGPPEEDQN